MTKRKTHLINAAIWILISGFLSYYIFRQSKISYDYLPLFKESPQEESQKENSNEEAKIEIRQDEPEILPQKVRNVAPFAPQAPFANWDALHEEACEEAAIITAHYFLKGTATLSPEDVDKNILAMVSYQEKNYGGNKDLPAEKIIQLASDFYKDTYRLVTNYNLRDIKEYLAKGSVIIVPAAGRVLENPNFKQPGPLYHALVIIGYDENKKQFITNDPGTRKGKDFRYSYTNLMESIHDFPGKKEDILKGKKVLIVVSK